MTFPGVKGAQCGEEAMPNTHIKGPGSRENTLLFNIMKIIIITLVGIDIDNASKKVDLKDLTLSHIPSEVHITSA